MSDTKTDATTQNTVEAALGAVLSALHGLTNDQRENVLLAASALYCLRVDYVSGDQIAVMSVERIVHAVRGGQ